ncbi:conserved hypothetical protein [Uncinocarpus reesii 1704]|uniref:Uncharacterized protein n=1 Tax=Uncinocarpus reesii (strain UAMH 1704) TaxID=336963 RepID=C4JYU5_UNCRE|nr:uncharacterized protein UREG_07346 [Uncinocarpus reesii 1704]EEP82481.1 conserved hypothetical protein [Uncinocarpus reesii 1704]
MTAPPVILIAPGLPCAVVVIHPGMITTGVLRVATALEDTIVNALLHLCAATITSVMGMVAALHHRVLVWTIIRHLAGPMRTLMTSGIRRRAIMMIRTCKVDTDVGL